ncbi:MAG: hypothetical protein ACKVJE_21500 [Pseudomonadales bacterium]|jgi:hypothetical protein
MNTAITSEQLYGVDRAILVDSPFVTPREYARRTGLTYSSVRNRIERGELPVYRPAGSSSVFVNMMVLARQAVEMEDEF